MFEYKKYECLYELDCDESKFEELRAPFVAARQAAYEKALAQYKEDEEREKERCRRSLRLYKPDWPPPNPKHYPNEFRDCDIVKLGLYKKREEERPQQPPRRLISLSLPKIIILSNIVIREADNPTPQ